MEEIQVPLEHMQRCPNFLGIKEMHIKIPFKYHFDPSDWQYPNAWRHTMLGKLREKKKSHALLEEGMLATAMANDVAVAVKVTNAHTL